jgi:D-alanyl-D-alanine endopeptidase (penicillin-binding protein 7)
MKIISLFIILCWASVAFGGEDEALDTYVPANTIRENANRVNLNLRSHAAIVFDERDNEVIMARNAEQVVPVASLSKLMTAMVILDADLGMEEVITITKDDKDRIRYSKSRLRTGMRFTRKDLLLIALAASENRAALALARTYPGGSEAFVSDMNRKAQTLGLTQTRFADPAGLSNDNVSTAQELMQLVKAASDYQVIREFSTQTQQSITDLNSQREITFGNTNRLVKKVAWPISLSKTGFTKDAGNCLVMQTQINARPVIIVLLNSWGTLSKYGDSNRIKKWLTKLERLVMNENSGQRALLSNIR